MRKILFMYYDERRADQAAISVPAARAFAEKNGYQIVVAETNGKLERPFMEKVFRCQEYLTQCDRLIYSDVDILFRANAVDDDLFPENFNCSTDFWGVCCGFMTFKPDPQVFKFLRIWGDLGTMRSGRFHDQGTLKALIGGWAWCDRVVGRIPQTLVSNHCTGDQGLVAHHFWSQSNPEDCVKRMKEFVWSPLNYEEAMQVVAAAKKKPGICAGPESSAVG